MNKVKENSLQRVDKASLTMIIGIDPGRPCAMAYSDKPTTSEITGVLTFPNILGVIAEISRLCKIHDPKSILIVLEAIYLDETQFSAAKAFAVLKTHNTEAQALNKLCQIARSNGRVEQDSVLLADFLFSKDLLTIEVPPSKRISFSQTAALRKKANSTPAQALALCKTPQAISQLLKSVSYPSKVDHKAFCMATGFAAKARTNQDERDAAMLVFELVKHPQQTTIVF